jgi:hypothetical protein
MVLGMVAEMERKFIRERQQAEVEAAKQTGVYKSRKPSVPVEKVKAEGWQPPLNCPILFHPRGPRCVSGPFTRRVSCALPVLPTARGFSC